MMFHQAAVDKYTMREDWSLSADGLQRQTWDSERGMLAAFADLDAARTVGFKKALQCLASTSCSLCQVP